MLKIITTKKYKQMEVQIALLENQIVKYEKLLCPHFFSYDCPTKNCPVHFKMAEVLDEMFMRNAVMSPEVAKLVKDAMFK